MARTSAAIRSISKGKAGSVREADRHPENGGDPVSAESRHRMISETAYYLAEQRGFEGNDEDRLLDWLQAEAEIDARLAQREI